MNIFTKGSEASFLFEIQGAPAMGVINFEACEEISEPFVLNITLASPSQIKFADMTQKEALLTIKGSLSDRYLHGIVKRFGFSGKNKSNYLYYAQVVPSFHLLSLEQDCRIFQNKNVQDIIADIFKDSNINTDRYAFRLMNQDRKRRFCVQYRESDMDFVSRLLQEEGIYYFFEHSKDKHVLVFADERNFYKPIPGNSNVTLNSGSGLTPQEEAISEIKLLKRLLPGKYTQTNYNFKRLDLPMETKEKSQEEKIQKYEVYDYPGQYSELNKGKKLAKMRLQQNTSLIEEAEGDSNCPRFSPGFTFKLNDHDIDAYNREYVIIGTSHSGSQPQTLEEQADNSGTTYNNHFLAIPSSTTYRPKKTIEKPYVKGMQTAIVVGPENEEIYVDEHNRVKVQFPWDRVGKEDEKSSCWLRSAQPWGGNGWGTVFIPRIGDEVLVDFMEGDPDWPIIVGSVYNGENRTLYDLPANKTRSTIKTRSYPNSDGFNELRFEDKSGQEEIFIHGEKDWSIRIKNDKNQNIGHDEALHVAHNRDKTIGINQSETIGNNKAITVGANHTETIGTNLTLSVGANKKDTTGINSAETIGAAKELTIGGLYQITVGGVFNETVAGAKTEEVGGISAAIVNNHMTQQIKGNRTEEIYEHVIIKADKIRIEAEESIMAETGAAGIDMKSGGDIKIFGTNIQIIGDGNIKFKGSNVSFKGPAAASASKLSMELTGLEAKITKLSFDSGIKVTIDKNKILAPHWQDEEKIEYEPTGYQSQKEYGTCSKKPAAYAIANNKNGCYLDIEVTVTKLENISGTAILSGRLMNMEIEGEFPLKLGINKLRAKIKNPPEEIQWYKGNIIWKISIKDKSTVKMLKNTFVEVFFILDKPAAFYKDGVWAEALRLLCKRAKVLNTKVEKIVTSRITEYCHSGHGLYYDSVGGGGPKYGGKKKELTGEGGAFYLSDYLIRKSIKANCFDQAAAIQSLCGAVGITLHWIFMWPFGYINETKLLGYGPCNNPFFEMNGTTKIIDINNKDRTGFGCHAFCSLGVNSIYDACARPHIGTSKGDYVLISIDKKTILKGYPRGDIKDMRKQGDYLTPLMKVTGVTVLK